jgi:hypothetical protein
MPAVQASPVAWAGHERWSTHWFAGAWLGIFYVLLVIGASPAPPAAHAFPALALAGLLYGWAFRREALKALLARHRTLLGASVAFVFAVLLAEGWLAFRGLRRSAGALPSQVGMLLCLAPLALFLQSRRLVRASVVLFGLFCLWHFVALPVEAIAGTRLGWFDMPLHHREWGPFDYQAAGLAWQVYFFAGLYLAMFYFAVGPAAEEGLWPRLVITPETQFLLGLVWLAVISGLQSRSAFAGVLAATLAGGIASLGGRSRRPWLALALAGLAGVALYWLLFHENKTPPGLRWAYLQLFVQRSLEWPWILTGRSYSVVPDGGMAVPGLEFLPHSHNDLAQVLFFWGLPVLLAYLVFWGALLRLAWTGFWRQGRRWPLLAFVAVLPSMVTDLGFHHYEKAAFMVILGGLCMALAGPRPERRI